MRKAKLSNFQKNIYYIFTKLEQGRISSMKKMQTREEKIGKFNYFKYRNFPSLPLSIALLHNKALQKLLGSEALDRKAYLAEMVASRRCVGGSCEKSASQSCGSLARSADYFQKRTEYIIKYLKMGARFLKIRERSYKYRNGES